MGKCATLLATCMFALSTVMTLVAVATTDWIKTDAKVLYRDTKYEDVLEAASFRDESDCRVGLWETCCTDVKEDACVTRMRDAEPWLWAVRICMVVSVAIIGLTVIFLLAYSFKDSLYENICFTQCLRFFIAISVIMQLMLVLAYGMVEYTMDNGLFDAKGATFGWSFYLFLGASLLNPIATFLMCSEWHFNEDEEAGILDVDYNKYDKAKKAIHS